MKIQKIVNISALVAMIAVNALANLIPFGGRTSGEISDMYPSFFTPAGISFSIWGMIYLLLAVLVVWSFFTDSESAEETLHDVGMLFALSCLLNILWIICWHTDMITLSTVLIVGLLISVFAIMYKSRKNAIAYAVFGLYAGWLTVATIAGMFVLVSSTGINVLNRAGSVVTVVALISATIIVSEVVLLTDSYTYALAAIWAMFGILIKHITTYESEHPVIIAFTVLGMLVVAAVTGYQMYTNYLNFGIKSLLKEKSQ